MVGQLSEAVGAADDLKVAGLFSAVSFRDMRLKNRIVVSPMQQYSATRDGFVTDWHKEHLCRLARGGAALIFTEAMAISPMSRLTYSDLGLWSDAHIEGAARLAAQIEDAGGTPGAQLIHAGRKAGVRRPWDGFEPLGAEDEAKGEPSWELVSASAIEANPGWKVPHPLSSDEIKRILEEFAAAAGRAARAGYQALNIHGAHGYLIHTFLSPLSNRRDDEYGGDRTARMRFALEVADAVRSKWPSNLPLFFRISAIDDQEGGWNLDDSIALSLELAKRGVDVVDCSSGGLNERATTRAIYREEGYQVPFASAIRAAGVPTMAVGLIRTPRYADQIVREGHCDLVALGRELLNNPFWPVHAAVDLEGESAYRLLPPQYGWWLARRAKTLRQEQEKPAGYHDGRPSSSKRS